VIREDAAMPISRFCALTGIPRRSYTRWRAKAAAGNPPKGPWPAPVVDVLEPVAAKYAADWPAWGHRKIAWLMAADGHTASASSIERALRRRGLLQPVDYQGQRRELAQARRAAFAQPPTGPNQVWQLDFTEFETTTGGTWRLAGCRDYWSKYELGWHISPTANQHDAIAAIELALTEAARLAGRGLHELAARDADGNVLSLITIVTDNGGPFRSFRFEAFIATHPELRHVRTRVRTPGQNGSRERGFGTLKYERLFLEEIGDVLDLTVHAEQYRVDYNTVRPHEALSWNRPHDVHVGLADPRIPNFPEPEILPTA
jgi:putative transposase